MDELISPERPRRIARAEYDRMVEMGLFRGERVELLHGVIIEMSATAPAHASPVDLLNELLLPRLLGRARVRVQQPLRAADESEPQPDIAVVPIADYSNAHPDRAYLLIEVADSSLRKDRHLKGPLYAESSVDEYWIVNIAARSVEVHRQPSRDGWGLVTRHEGDAMLSLAVFPDVSFRISDFLR